MPEHAATFGPVLFVVSLICSALGGMLGMAGGVFLVPALSEFCRLDLHVAITASLVSVIACSCGSAAPFLKSSLTNIRLAVVLEVATTFGALVGILLFGVLPKQFLLCLFAAILVISAQQMFSKRNSAPSIGEIDENSLAHRLGLNPSLDFKDPYKIQRLPLGMILMFGAGLISALLGIGSGVLKIPAMDSALRLPIKASSATSNFMIGVTASASACAYFAHGDIVPSIAAPVALGAIVGAPLGARLLMSLPNQKLRVAFSVVLAGLAIQMVLSALGLHVFKGGE